jgi:hypothetical protein
LRKKITRDSTSLVKALPSILVIASILLPVVSSPADDKLCQPKPPFENPVFEIPAREQPARMDSGFEKPIFEKPRFEKEKWSNPRFEKPMMERPAFQRECIESLARKTPAAEENPVVFPRDAEKEWGKVRTDRHKLRSNFSHSLKMRQSPERR